jgi:hypothetical protein
MFDIELVKAVLYILFGFGLSMGKSYFEQKGKDFATKESIGDITKTVKRVEHSFTEKITKLNSRLTLVTNVFSGLVVEERNAIVDFNEKYSVWLTSLIDSSFGGGSINNLAEIKEHQKQIQVYRSNYVNSQARFYLFIGDNEFRGLASSLEVKTIELLVMLKMNYIQEVERIIIQKQIIQGAYTPENSLESEQRINDLLSELSNCIDTFNNGVVVAMRIISPLNFTFYEKCRSHLYHLVENRN